jgi:hypothetical protein
MLTFWLLRMAFLAVLFAWIGRSVVLLSEGERDFYTAFQRGLFLVPDTLSLAWREILDFAAPLRERLFPPKPLYIGPDVAPSPPPQDSSSALPSFTFALSPAVLECCWWIAGAQALVTLWALMARRDAARMWTSPGTLAVLEPRARVIFYGIPLTLAGVEIVRAWPASTGDALLIAAFALLLRFFPWLTGLPFWIAEEVLGFNFAALRTLGFLPRMRRPVSKAGSDREDSPRPDYPSALALFGLSADCTAEDAVNAYRAHLRLNHPGHGGGADRAKTLNAAFEAIKNQRGWA